MDADSHNTAFMPGSPERHPQNLEQGLTAAGRLKVVDRTGRAARLP